MNILLVPVDFSKVTDIVIQHATRMASAFDGEIYLLHVEPPNPDFVGYEPGPDSVRDAVAKGIREDMHEIHVLRDRLREQGVQVESLVIQGPTVQKILEESQRLQADAIVLGSHGRGALMNLLMGSVCEGVIREASCPVVVIPASRLA